MTQRTLQSTFSAKLDSILRGIDTRQITAADKLAAIDSALAYYSQDKPALRSLDFAGTSDRYYVLHGAVVTVDDTTRDAAIDLTSTGADSRLSIAFTLPRKMTIQAVRVLLRRTGSPAGTLACSIALPSGSLPSSLYAQTSASLTSVTDLPLGFEAGKTEFRFSAPTALNAGTYYLTIVATGYTYTDGTTEIVLGVDQSGVTNSVYTYNGAVWAAYGTVSAGVVDVIASLPGYDFQWSRISGTDIPAPTITLNQIAQPLEAEDFEIAQVGDTQYLYLPNWQPTSAETVRLWYTGRYVFDGSPLAVDVPTSHFEAVCTFAAHYVCRWLSIRYGQNIDSGLTADISDRRSQSDVYASRAKEFLTQYEALLGLGEDANVEPAMVIGDMDRGTYAPTDFLFHQRKKR